MWGRKGQSKKKDPKKIASALRSAIAGEELVKDAANGIDLSKLSSDQLNAIVEVQNSDLPPDEQRERVEKILRNDFVVYRIPDNGREAKKPFTWFGNGVEPITGMKFTDGDDKD